MNQGRIVMIRGFLKELIFKNNRFFQIALKVYNHMFGLNHIQGKRYNRISTEGAFLRKCNIHIHGKNNCVVVGHQCVLKNCSISIFGNNNNIHLYEGVSAANCEMQIEDNNNRIKIGSNSHLCGPIHVACIEGTRVEIGEQCLFSSDITIRTGDSHTILNQHGLRINPSQNVSIDHHVWVGNKVIITKGSKIAAHSVVATGTIVTKKFKETNVILGGNPAKIIKKEINWKEERL